MRNGGHVLDHLDLQAASLQGTDGSLTTGAGALDEDFDRLQAVLHGRLGSRLSGGLRGEGLEFSISEPQARQEPFKI